MPGGLLEPLEEGHEEKPEKDDGAEDVVEGPIPFSTMVDGVPDVLGCRRVCMAVWIGGRSLGLVSTNTLANLEVCLLLFPIFLQSL